MVTRQESSQNSSPATGDNILSSLAQAGTDALTCQGFGGIAAVALGLKNSGALKVATGSAVPLDNQTLAALPKGPIIIKSQGNQYEIKIHNTEIMINGISLLSFAVFSALHGMWTLLFGIISLCIF
jgi:hypothetical protein